MKGDLGDFEHGMVLGARWAGGEHPPPDSFWRRVVPMHLCVISIRGVVDQFSVAGDSSHGARLTNSPTTCPPSDGPPFGNCKDFQPSEPRLQRSNLFPPWKTCLISLSKPVPLLPPHKSYNPITCHLPSPQIGGVSDPTISVRHDRTLQPAYRPSRSTQENINGTKLTHSVT
ncbi:hypothetical protein CCH79_00018809 [Gambusia affinis]|uniref:Uncharacterized protein n=1 Tax=Gambusia affinis TaxID=33528 RepID=A0A315VT06_GAMAF|nr:hypothetical protein CCH79_00018809 [Gambusia affinis]